MMQQITIRMNGEDLGRIEAIARSTGLKKSDITRMAIRRFVEEYTPGKDEKIYNKVKHLVGAAESGLSDLGLNHRRHLIDKIKSSQK